MLETAEQLRPIFEQHWPKGWDQEPTYKWTDADLTKVAELRERARTEHFFLGNQLLAFDFFEDVHTALFDAMLQKDPSRSLFEQDSIKRRLILWSRGHYKTSAEVVEIVQLILCFPNITILIVSGKQDLAREIVAMAKDAFENNERMAELFPEYCGKRLGNKSCFSVPNRRVSHKQRGGTVNISSAKSTKSGIHADVIFADDLVHDTNYQTPELIEKTHKVYFSFSGPILKDGGFLYILGTRYVHNDLYGTILAAITEKGFKPLKAVKTYQITPRWQESNHVSADGNWYVSIRSCWKRYENGDIDLLFGQRGPAKDGELKGFTLNNLLQIQRDNPTDFACHYENLPLAGGSQVFTEELLDSIAVLFEQIPKRGTTIVIWDLAWGKHKNADSSVGIVARMDTSQKWYVIDCLAGRFNPDQLVKNIILLHSKYRCHTTFLEEAQGAPWLANSVGNYCKLIGIEIPNVSFLQPSNKQGIKEIRIKSLAPVMTAKRLHLFAGMAEYENLKQAFLDYPNAGHDDYPDAVSLLLEIVPFVDPNPSRMEQELRRQAEATQELIPNPFCGSGSIA
jgi:predicted phage terminase large subunit-like protein